VNVPTDTLWRAGITTGLMVALIAVAPVEARATQRTEATVDGETIRIKTRVEIHGRRASDALAAVIEGQINSVWQDPANQHTYCGKKVEFEAEVRLQPGSGTDGWHQIEIANVRPGQFYRSWVGGGDPYTGDLGGKWGTSGGLYARRGDFEYAHEGGHLFGAPDDYTDHFFTGSQPNPGREGTLMADNVGWIDAAVVNTILQEAFPDGGWDLPRCIQGTTYQEVTIQEGGHERTGFLSLTVMLETAGEEALRGTATGEFTLAGTYEDGGCEFTYNTATPIELDLQAEGEGDGPYTIEAELPILIDEVQRHSLCDTPVDLVIDWEVTLKLEDVLFGEFELPNGTKLDHQYHLEEETSDGKRQVDLWLNGIPGQ